MLEVMQDAERQHWAALVDLLEELIRGQVGLTEGCRLVVDKYYPLERDNALFNPFKGFESESDAFPIGDVRDLCAPASLHRMDLLRESTEAWYRDWLVEAAKKLLACAKERAAVNFTETS
jgi:hypothetical protein